ncbi:MAG: YjbE family putative metal transport protein [Sphingomonadaceae bacterium]|uniref:YjbE family putative metal transport protein n=1 Tax=Thermaurantiacus sp. TaxID=2820283 RepID=UPI00298F3151|nr:YjbE family putative metal transport protein [Thermaurantiacus sp.]MCS6987250.1 YjbE family putative metal transport protein [Sphingomonadaceae bacterium]MDW8414470.1 YjbE family putative metal transport protein [Thermaurantiacus sp.]
MDLSFLTDPSALRALALVVLIDIALAGDNAIVVGALAAGLPARQRRHVIVLGVVAALVLRIGFALVVNQLLRIIGVRLAGGLLLLWVTWKMYREMRPDTRVVLESGVVVHDAPPAPKSFWGAAWAVAVADVSMSLDNVLAVASAAGEHPEVMAIGIVLAVVLMGVAANVIARLIERHRWVGWLGVLVILYVALKMIWEGSVEVAPVVEAFAGEV